MENHWLESYPPEGVLNDKFMALRETLHEAQVGKSLRRKSRTTR